MQNKVVMVDMTKQRIRTCVGCGATESKGGLVRLVRTASGEVHVDPTGRAAGRGAYVCKHRACFDAARKGMRLNAALRVRLDDASWLQLEKEFDMLCATHSDVQ